MKKLILGALLATTLTVSNVCSAEWLYAGDYVVNQSFINSVETIEDSVKLIDNLSPKPANWQKLYYRLEYDDNGELTRGGEDNSLVYLKVATRLWPMNANNTPAIDRYGLVVNVLSIAPKGIYGVTSIENGIIDFPPKVQYDRVRLHSQKPVFLGVLKRYSAIEYVGQRFSSEIVGTSDW